MTNTKIDNDSVLENSDTARKINNEIQQKVAPHLFLFCNYKSVPLTPLNLDAKFIKAVLNLYKLLVDCGVANRIKKLSKSCDVPFNCNKLDKSISIASTLRTAIAHNNSKLDEYDSSSNDYKNWIKEKLGKTSPTTSQDYDTLLSAVEKIARDAISQIEIFIHIVASLPTDKKNNLIKSWEDAIIDFYLKDSGKELFFSFLKQTYSIRNSLNPPYTSLDSEHFRDFCQWIKDNVYCKDQERIYNYKYLIADHKLSPDTLKKLQSEIALLEKKVAETSEKIAKYFNRPVDSLKPFHYKDFYLSNDEYHARLQTALKAIKSSGGTLLVDNIFQKIIEKDFPIL